jgi:hypothetical protein
MSNTEKTLMEKMEEWSKKVDVPLCHCKRDKVFYICIDKDCKNPRKLYCTNCL